MTAASRPPAVVASEDRDALFATFRELAEPVDLRRRLIAVFGDEPERARDEAVRLLSQRLWRRWSGALGPVGATPKLLRDVCRSGDRELWLWVTGDRPWVHVVDGLAGRLLRRLGS